MNKTNSAPVVTIFQRCTSCRRTGGYTDSPSRIDREKSDREHQAKTIADAPTLRRNSLGLGELVFHGITHIAPATNVVFTFPIIALKAGPAMPISFFFTTIICLLIANTVSEFSKFMPSSGGYYSFATRGLGSRAGFIAT